MSHLDLAVGAELPPLERSFELTDLVAYAGATWDWHKLHYDRDYLATKGLPAPVVDGQVFGALLAAQIQDFFGPNAVLLSLHFRFKNLVFAGQSVRCRSRIVAVEFDGDADLDVVTLECTVEILDASSDAPPSLAVAPAGATILVRR